MSTVEWVKTFQTDVNCHSNLPTVTYAVVCELEKLMEKQGWKPIDVDRAISYIKQRDSLRNTNEYPLQLYNPQLFQNPYA